MLVANRGEIAIRVFRTLRELGIGVRRRLLGRRRRFAARRVRRRGLGGRRRPALRELPRGAGRIVETARRSGAEAVHPGYGFLAENAGVRAGIRRRRPRLDRAAAGGDRGDGLQDRRTRAHEGGRRARRPGTTEPLASPDDLVRLGAELGWPLAIKASAGGGGKGFKVVAGPEEAERALEAARREGEAYFSDATVYVERYLEDPRHVEVQVLADAHGNVIHLGERDCTIQRRHQKLVEETPSPAVDGALRERIGRIAVDAARAVGYRSAGTIEGLLTRTASTSSWR